VWRTGIARRVDRSETVFAGSSPLYWVESGGVSARSTRVILAESPSEVSSVDLKHVASDVFAVND